MKLLINDRIISVNGTHLQGYINTTLANLESKLGPIEYDHMDDKCKGSYSIQGTTVDEESGEEKTTVATIYCWKTSDVPTEKHRWHIGGHTQDAVEMISELFDLPSNQIETARNNNLFTGIY